MEDAAEVLAGDSEMFSRCGDGEMGLYWPGLFGYRFVCVTCHGYDIMQN